MNTSGKRSPGIAQPKGSLSEALLHLSIISETRPGKKVVFKK